MDFFDYIINRNAAQKENPDKLSSYREAAELICMCWNKLDMSHLVGDERYHDRLTYDGLWENNLYQFFRIVSPKVQFDLPRPFKLEKGGKRNDDTPQHEAVREAFTNAIIHCDLMMDAGILRIEKHDDRLCFRNPGLLKLPVEAIYRGGNSKLGRTTTAEQTGC